ncbi:MAG: hypothetical protein LIO68_01775 [Rikenellaceae bacterium]|nr:hypothetical protein [Rikenellaceae bacterium]
MLEFFSNNPIFNIITLTLALIGIILTVYFAVQARRAKKPVYAIRTINLVKDKLAKIDRVEMLFDGKRIDNLSVSRLALWNDGKETIRTTDMSKLNPLKITISEDYQILDCKILYQRNPANNFTTAIEDDGKSVSMGFDYFDYREGVVLEIAHTGINSTCLCMKGSLMGVHKICTRMVRKLPFGQPSKKTEKIFRTIAGWTLIIFSLVLLTVTILIIAISNRKFNMDDDPFFLGIAVLYLIFGYFLLPRSTVPKGLDVFNGEF